MTRHRTPPAATTASLVVALAAVAACGGPRSASPPPGGDAGGDARIAVALPADGRIAVLREMRQMLGAVGGALGAAAAGDTSAVIAALTPAGRAAAADPALESLLPADWKTLAERTHGGFDDLIAAVRRARGPQALKDTVIVGIARISGDCSGCHETYRVTVK